MSEEESRQQKFCQSKNDKSLLNIGEILAQKVGMIFVKKVAVNCCHIEEKIDKKVVKNCPPF